MSFLQVGFQISRVDVISYVDIKVAIESGSEDLDGDFGGWEVCSVPHWL